MKVEHCGSVRVDLLGGTLDLYPINLILENVVTLNVATSLKAYVTIEKTNKEGVTIESIDYDSSQNFMPHDFSDDNFRQGFFGPLSFVAQILKRFDLCNNVQVTLRSDSPAGAGLGGSSAMGVTLFHAISDYQKINFEKKDAINIVQDFESIILDSGPAGYQDYYPALYGGVLALRPMSGEINVEQLYTAELKEVLESRITLVYSGQSRSSGINNWEVYKQFFDKDEQTRTGLSEISDLSFKAYECIKEKKYDDLIELISKEGKARAKLFPNILSQKMKTFYDKLNEGLPNTGIKACGAGGGGCFLLTHSVQDGEKVKKMVEENEMKVMPFHIERALD